MRCRPSRARPVYRFSSSRARRLALPWIAAVALLASRVRAEPPPPTTPTPTTPTATTTPTRSLWIAPTYQFLFTDAFEPSSRHGVGAAASYEFHISPRFDIGLTLAYRLYPGSTATRQLGYGVLLKHFFSPAWSYADGIYPYLDYGLLLQQSYVENRRSSAVSHDTRLGGGIVLRSWGVPLFIDVAGHYSRLQYFDTDTRAIPYLEVSVGWAHAF